MQFLNIKQAIFLTVVCFFTLESYSQKMENYRAENRLGVVTGLDLMLFDTTSNPSLNYNYEDVLTPTIGVQYHFKTLKLIPNAHISVGLNIKNTRNTRKAVFEPDNEGAPPGFLEVISIRTESPFWTYHLPISFNYLVYDDKTIDIHLVGNFESQYYSFTKGVETFDETRVFLEPGIPTTIIETTAREHQSALTFGVGLGLSTTFYTNRGNGYKVSLMYHEHFNNIWRYDHRVMNLRFSPDANFTSRWTGDYVAFRLEFLPKWLNFNK